MSHIKTKLEQAFLRISHVSANDPGLKNVAQMTNVAGKIIEATRSS